MKFGRIKRQHGRVGGLDAILNRIIKECPHVSRIVPGRIKVRRGKTPASFKVQYPTPAGLKYSIVIAPANGEVADNVKAKGNGKSRAETSKQDESVGRENERGERGPVYAVVIAASTGGIRSVLKKHQEVEVSPGTELEFVAKRDVIMKKVVQSGDRK